MYTQPRSVNEKDDSELLKEAEPIDYRPEMTSDNYRSRSTATAGGYQSQSQYSRVNRPSGRAPPKGIFDDV